MIEVISITYKNDSKDIEILPDVINFFLDVTSGIRQDLLALLCCVR